MSLIPIDEGFIAQAEGSILVGSRCAVTAQGDLVCSFMKTAALGTNDFVPLLFRSTDQGKSWVEQGPIWPGAQDHWSIFVSISSDARGRLFMYGTRTPIEQAGEPFWSEATQGLKQNELIWASSDDGGQSWSEPSVIPMPIPSTAEAPGALCVTRTGRWLAPYSPYPTFHPGPLVARDQVICVFSDDEGRTWKHSTMLHLREPNSGAAEAWLVELADGRLLGTCWHLNLSGGGDYPNAFAISHDGGSTWMPAASTSILGQSTALAALPDGRALFIYNQRRHGEPGVWLAMVRPTDADFGIESNEIVWRAQTTTRSGSSGDLAQWEDFSFGEPSITPLSDGTLLVTLWCVQPTGRGIRRVKLRFE